MKIGIVGTGNMGKALGVGWARAGHEVLFGSRDLAKAKALGRAGSFEEAAAFGDVILYSLRDVPPTKQLRDAGVLEGKVLIDCNNSEFLDPKRATFPLSRPGHSIAETLASDVPRARVVKAFNTHPAQVLNISVDVLRPQRVSAFIAGDDPEARKTVGTLAKDLGLVPVDSGGLERAYLLEGLAGFLRFQIAAQGLGMYATLSLHLLEPGAKS